MSKVIYTHHYHKGERERLEKEYRNMTDRELIYEWQQPDCLGCQESVRRTGTVPVFCSECCTVRDMTSPLLQEMKYRNLWRLV